MAISADQLVQGRIYITAGEQLRMITSMSGGKVHYQSKSAKQPNRSWDEGQLAANAPSVETFCADVDHRLTLAELETLIASGVLTAADLQ
jgi:hypothetical protein